MSGSAIVIPEIQLADAILQARSTMGTHVREEELTALKRVSFGRADPIPLMPDPEDDDLRESLLRDAGHRYWVLAFTCSFQPGDEPILESGLAVQLGPGPADTSDDGPLVWALDPELLSTKSERTKTFRINPKVVVATVGELQLGELTNEKKLQVKTAYVVGTGKLQSVARWFFRAPPSAALEGMHDLRMLVRVPAGHATNAQIVMTAKIRRRFAGVVPYRATLPPDARQLTIPA